MSIYNLSKIEEMTDGDSAFIRTMVETFIAELPEDIAALNEAIDFGNAALTYEIVHKMKPNLQLFGLQLSMEIEQLEAWYKAKLQRGDILESAERIVNRVQQAIAELKVDFHLV